MTKKYTLFSVVYSVFEGSDTPHVKWYLYRLLMEVFQLDALPSAIDD